MRIGALMNLLCGLGLCFSGVGLVFGFGHVTTGEVWGLLPVGLGLALISATLNRQNQHPT